jgi:hypothetical protein
MATSPWSQDFGGQSDAMAVFFAWEKLRIVYNLLLMGVVLSLGLAAGKNHNIAFWVNMACQGFMANVCFCAGPVAEGYLCWIGCERRVARWILFLGGLLLSVGLAYYLVQHVDPLNGSGFVPF